jgi:hypothetical protein
MRKAVDESRSISLMNINETVLKKLFLSQPLWYLKRMIIHYDQVGLLASFLPLWQNTWDNELIKRKVLLFWLTVSEVSVYSHLTPLPLGLWWHNTSQWRVHGKEAAQVMAPRKQTEKERRGQGLIISFNVIRLISNLLSPGPTS